MATEFHPIQRRGNEILKQLRVSEKGKLEYELKTPNAIPLSIYLSISLLGLILPLPSELTDVIEEARPADHRLNTRVLLLDNYPRPRVIAAIQERHAVTGRNNSANGDFESDCPGQKLRYTRLAHLHQS